MNTIITEIIGYSAAVIGTSLMLPQVFKSLKSKSVQDLSYLMLILYFLNCLLWASYGFLIYAIPVIICNLLALAISIFQLGLKVKYSK
ncbi:SemiSWEET family sugar transporter [Patescibacteria group bacterium]